MINFEKNDSTYFIPFQARKSLHPYSYKSFNPQINNKIKKDENSNIKTNSNTFTNLKKKKTFGKKYVLTM